MLYSRKKCGYTEENQSVCPALPEKGNAMEFVFHYIVDHFDGDYVYLRRTDTNDGELFCIAQALLPDGIEEGTHLRYEVPQYFIED